jgi:predicted nuclease of predicted toxin-antitoxin system
MPLGWQFLLNRGVNFRTKRLLLAAGFPAVFQLEEVGLTGLATDPEIFSEAQQRRLILITKDTDFIREVRYALWHDGILYVRQSRTELQDTVSAALTLTGQFSSLVNMRFIVEVDGRVQQVVAGGHP